MASIIFQPKKLSGPKLKREPGGVFHPDCKCRILLSLIETTVQPVFHIPIKIELSLSFNNPFRFLPNSPEFPESIMGESNRRSLPILSLFWQTTNRYSESSFAEIPPGNIWNEVEDQRLIASVFFIPDCRSALRNEN